MTRRTCPLLGLGILLIPVVMLAGCGGETPRPVSTVRSGEAPGADTDATKAARTELDRGVSEHKNMILETVLKLIRDAATNPSGQNFNIATDNLNDYFLGTPDSDFVLSPPVREFLVTNQIPGEVLQDIERSKFEPLRDGRHIEDSLLYQAIASRVAGDGDDLTRASRIFDWVVQQVQLVPAGWLAAPAPLGFQAQVRPFDALLRGMATETGSWAERSWLFMMLCRQIGVDVGLLSFNRPLRGPVSRKLENLAASENLTWVCGVLIGGDVYLFDAHLGMPIPKANGRGIATLEEAATERNTLAQLDLPGRPYMTNQAELAKKKIRVVIESTPAGMAPRMRLLQKDLTGKDRMILYRDPRELAAAFQAAMGPWFEGVELWPLPMEVMFRLFGDSNFVAATQFPMQIFDSRWPLKSARMMQLLGDLPASLQKYVSFRYGEGVMQADGKEPIPPEIQLVLDMFSTYYLALGQLDKGELAQAEVMFRETLRLLPEPGRGRPYFCMFRWGAETNLGRLYEKRGEKAQAIRCYTEETNTPQLEGNLIRARQLIWQDPFVPPADTPTLPTPPAGFQTVTR